MHGLDPVPDSDVVADILTVAEVFSNHLIAWLDPQLTVYVTARQSPSESVQAGGPS